MKEQNSLFSIFDQAFSPAQEVEQADKAFQSTDYHAQYFAHALTLKHPADDMAKLTAALQDAKVDLNPHQVDAALFAFQSPLSKGVILADEVGLGKTIEAGILLSQMWAERKRRLLVVAPANLRKQWSIELEDKFYLPSIILESKNFNLEKRTHKRKNPFEQEVIVICSYEFARGKQAEIKKVKWDLVIIDEAHRLRNVYKEDNKTATSIKEALKDAKKVLMTATPLQNSLLELYGLISIIDDYAFGDAKSFSAQYARAGSEKNFDVLKKRLEPLCKRTLRRQVMEYVRYTKRVAMVEEFYPNQNEQLLYDKVSLYLMEEHLHALPEKQRALMALMLRKLLASSTRAIQGTLTKLADKLNEAAELGYWPAKNVSEFEDVLYDETDDSEDEIIPMSPEAIEGIKKEEKRLRGFAKLANTKEDDAKAEKLLTALQKGFEKLDELGAQQKALIFTEFTRTQEYLKKLLEKHGYKGKIVLFNGTNKDKESLEILKKWREKHKDSDRVTGSATADMRQALVDKFREEGKIMIATEAAAEGINLQFCSLVVNYDMPWNPQRIEQRIGRCHRYGQRFDVVVINFLNKENAADQRVYELLDLKFKLFSGVFGASDEILGTIGSDFDFGKRVAEIYNKCRTANEIQQAFDKLQAEMAPEIESRITRTRKDLLENFDEEVSAKLRAKLEAGKRFLNRFERWLWNLAQRELREHAHFLSDNDSFYLRANPFPKLDIRTGRYRLFRSESTAKKSEIDPGLDSHIFRFGHPLAQEAIQQAKQRKLPNARVVFDFTGATPKPAALRALVGKTGWLRLGLLRVTALEAPEFLIFSAFDNEGEALDNELATKLFDLSARVLGPAVLDKASRAMLELLETEATSALVEERAQKDNEAFTLEMDKIDQWAEDRKLGLQKEIEDLKETIKLKKSEARLIRNLNAKLEEQRKIKDKEAQLREKQKNLYDAEMKIEAVKDALLDETQKSLNQQTQLKTIFTLQWTIA